MKRNNTYSHTSQKKTLGMLLSFFLLFVFFSLNYVSAIQQDFTTWDISNPTKLGSTGDTIALYRLDEPSGSTIYDETGNYDGTVVGSVTINQNGLKNKSYSFDGGYGQIRGLPSGTFAIQMWINSNDTNANSNRRWFFGEQDKYAMTTGYNNHSFEFYWGGYGLPNYWIISSDIGSAWNDGNYHQIIFQNNGTDFEFYYDGVFVNSSAGTFNDGTATMHLARYEGQTLEAYRGDIDEPVIWNRALNQTEITGLYNLSEDYYNFGTRAGNLLTITPTRIIYSENQTEANSSFYVQKAYGNLNGNFMHNFTLNVSNTIGTTYSPVWSISNSGGSVENFNANDLIFYVYEDAGRYAMDFFNWINEDITFSIYGLDFLGLEYNTNYYFSVTRTGNNFSVSVYNNSNRTDLIDYQTADFSGSLASYNYVGLASGIITSYGGAGNQTFYMENFDDGLAFVPAGTGGGILDFVFNYGKEDMPSWVRILLSLVTIIAIAVALNLYSGRKNKK